MKTKKKNPADLTTRNAKSYNKRLKKLESVVINLADTWSPYIIEIEERLQALETQNKQVMKYIQTYFIKGKK